MTREMHRGKMQVILKDWGPSRVLDCEMSQEDEAELNVMDFVETEYKFESNDQAKTSKRKFAEERKNKNQKCWGVSVEKVRDSPRGTRVKINKKPRTTQKLPSEKTESDSNFAVVYPYAACLKSLCDKVGTHQDPLSDSLSARLFDQLHHLEVHYPYAALLRELYLTAQADSTNVPSTRPEVNCQGQGAAELIKTLNCQIDLKSGCSKQSRIDSSDFEMPYSKMLITMIKQHKKWESKEKWKNICTRGSGGIKGIGKILRNSMAEDHIEHLPLRELHSSALLRKISIAAQKNESSLAGGNHQYSYRRNQEHSSTDSSQSEVDDSDWKPSRARKKAANGLTPTKKRKSERRKRQSQVRACSSGVATTLHNPKSTAEKIDCETKSESLAPSRLLQLIMGKDQKELTSSLEKLSARKLKTKTRDNKSATSSNCENLDKSRASFRKVSVKKNKMNLVKSELADSVEALSREREELSLIKKATPKKYAGSTQIPLEENSREQQSLLKEYLLKPAGEEIKTEETYDMPKVETHFLFSRMLQNFKILAEASSSESITERDQEAQSVPNILRGMLVTGNTDGELHSDGEVNLDLADNKSLIQSALQKNNLFSEQYPGSNVECDNSVICKVEYEGDPCKVEQEEDSFECQVCHLQFSSGIDLSNHQVLFHCAEDPQASGSRVVLSHGVDNLQNTVLQEKLPA